MLVAAVGCITLKISGIKPCIEQTVCRSLAEYLHAWLLRTQPLACVKEKNLSAQSLQN